MTEMLFSASDLDRVEAIAEVRLSNFIASLLRTPTPIEHDGGAMDVAVKKLEAYKAELAKHLEDIAEAGGVRAYMANVAAEGKEAGG